MRIRHVTGASSRLHHNFAGSFLNFFRAFIANRVLRAGLIFSTFHIFRKSTRHVNSNIKRIINAKQRSTRVNKFSIVRRSRINTITISISRHFNLHLINITRRTNRHRQANISKNSRRAHFFYNVHDFFRAATRDNCRGTVGLLTILLIVRCERQRRIGFKFLGKR